MINDLIKVKGELKLTLTSPQGNVKHEVIVPNLVVTAGKNFIAAAAAGNTALGSEAGRVALTSSTVSTNSVAYVASFGAGTGTGAITEAGLLNASSSGTLLCRTVFSVINKGASDTLGITWTVTIS